MKKIFSVFMFVFVMCCNAQFSLAACKITPPILTDVSNSTNGTTLIVSVKSFPTGVDTLGFKIATDLAFTENVQYNTTTNTSTTFDGLTPAQRYYITVKSIAVDQGSSDWAIENDKTVMLGDCVPPTVVSEVITDDGIDTFNADLELSEIAQVHFGYIIDDIEWYYASMVDTGTELDIDLQISLDDGETAFFKYRVSNYNSEDLADTCWTE